MYDTTVLRPFGARDSSPITQRDPHPEEPGTGVAGTGEPGIEAADRADDLLAAILITNWTLATGSPDDPETLADLKFAWRTCRAVKSNAIVIAKGGATVGVGMGQVNRVDAARLAVERGGDRVVGAVAASDAFFPFLDGLETLTDAGVKAIVHPGGSMRDDVVTEAAAKAGITLYLTGARHFAH